MDLGIAHYQPGDGPLAQRLQARWASCVADLSAEDLPNHYALHADMDAHGCRPVVDMRTTLACMADMIAGEGDVLERRDAAIRHFADRILRYLDRHETVRTVEVWEGAQCAIFVHGRGELLHYATVLSQVYARLKGERPDVHVLTGGFGAALGAIADLTVLEYALAQYCPRDFDAANLHPWLNSSGYREVDVATFAERLARAREVLDRKCAGQPIVATGFGIPTAQVPPVPSYYGRFWKRLGVRIIPEADALDWWLGLLDVARRGGYEFVCVLARDQVPLMRFPQMCGLQRADGTDKAFTADLCAALTQ